MFASRHHDFAGQLNLSGAPTLAICRLATVGVTSASSRAKLDRSDTVEVVVRMPGVDADIRAKLSGAVVVETRNCL